MLVLPFFNLYNIYAKRYKIVNVIDKKHTYNIPNKFYIKYNLF